MDGEKFTKVLELRTGEGALVAVVLIKEMTVCMRDNLPLNPKPEETPPEETKTRESEPLMTDPQKRYLFRLLAEQGIENDSAYDHLKKKFKVSNLKEVTKAEASKEIERLIAELKGGESYAH